MSTLSPLGDCTAPLGALHALLSNRVVAAELVMLPEWAGRGRGRPRTALVLENGTLLGAAFSISGVPNVHAPGPARRPSLAEEAWPGGVPAPAPVLQSALHALQTATASLHASLHALVLVVLRNQVRAGGASGRPARGLGGVDGRGSRACPRASVAGGRATGRGRVIALPGASVGVW